MFRSRWQRLLSPQSSPSCCPRYRPQLEEMEARHLLSGDVVLDWNAQILNAIRAAKTGPPPASRQLAMLHIAMYDAIDLITQTSALYPVPGLTAVPPPGASPTVAAAAAANFVLDKLYPALAGPYFDAHFQLFLSQYPAASAPATLTSIAFGQAVGAAVVAWRNQDGASAVVPYTPGNNPGQWQQTPPGFLPAAFTQWPYVAPFGVTSGSQFRPAGPPALNSAAYQSAFNEVLSLGRSNSTTRTADQTQVADFWADGSGTATPPGHWNEIATQVALQQGTTLVQNARLFALLNIALADAAIVCWDAKYVYNFWRPITAIQQTVDPSWTSLLVTPNFPSYFSGHSTFSSSAAAVLTSFFGTNFPFSTGSDFLPGVTRSFSSFAQAAAEAGQSRIYGGIHFQFDNQDGLAAGNALANYDLAHFLLPTAPHDLLVSGAGAGSRPEVKVFDTATLVPRYDFLAFSANFTGGVRVATGDFNGDGVADIIAAAGAGGGGEVKVFSGATGAILADFFAFNGPFTAGLFVAAGDVNADGYADIIVSPDAGPAEVKVFGGGPLAGQQLRDFLAFSPALTGGATVASGDVNGDGFADIISAADAGGGPQVTITSGKDGRQLASFYATAATFTGGIRVAAGDVNGDGFADVIAAAGAGGGPQVTVFDGRTLKLMTAFYAFAPGFAGGMFVAAGDVTGNGTDDIVVGADKGGGPQVAVFDGPTQRQLNSYYAFTPSFTGGVRVAVVQRTRDNFSEVLTAAGPGGGPQVETFDGQGKLADSFFAYNSTYTGGVFLGGA